MCTLFTHFDAFVHLKIILFTPNLLTNGTKLNDLHCVLLGY